MGAGAINELKEDPIKLAIGRTVTGGSIGMAALDGYAAAIEVFAFYSNLRIHTQRPEIR
jgi:hypothetical protein